MPREAVIASIASSQRAGLPIRIALAIVSGLAIGCPSTSGAAPAAWKPNSRGATSSSPNPRHQAVTLPALPTGMQSASGRAAEVLDDLERRRLLTLEPEGVDRVDERDRVLVAELAHERERLVEVAAQRDDARAVHERLGELARRDAPVGHDHRAA